MRELKDVIKELREGHGTQVQVSEKIGISSQLLGQYEAGRQKPKIDFFEKWEEVFGEDIRAVQKGKNERNVSRETDKHTSVQKPGDNKQMSESVYRTIVEGNTEYVLIPRTVLADVQLISKSQIARDNGLMDKLLDLNEKLTSKMLALEAKPSTVQQGEKSA